MLFKVLCILLLIKALKIDSRRSIPISAITHRSIDMTSSIVNTTESINLPHGFNPQPSPMNPLLYPFVTEEPIKIVGDSTSGWRPIIGSRVTTPSPALMPFLEDRHAMSSKESQESQTVDTPIIDSIIYGAWKPERPIQPGLTAAENVVTKNVMSNGTGQIFKNVIRRRLGGFIEENRHRIPSNKDSSEKMSSFESIEESRNLRTQSHKKQGRRKIPNFSEKKNYESNESENINSMNVVKVNANDPELLNIIKQINKSVETPNIVKSLSKETLSEEYSYAPTLQNSNSNKISKEWPIDFINSNEGNRVQDNGPKNHNFNFVGDSSEPPQGIASLSFDDLLASTTDLNITKMGIPFEEQNSNEEPSICVPLAVQERSASNPNEIVNVERVYCFPLPPPDTKRPNENEAVPLDKNGNYSVLSYEELTNSSAAYIKETIILITISFFLL